MGIENTLARFLAVLSIILVAGGNVRAQAPSHLPTGRFVLIEGALLKRKVTIQVSTSTVVGGEVVTTAVPTPTGLTKTITIDGKGNLSEEISAGGVQLNRGQEKLRYREIGDSKIELIDAVGHKRIVTYAFIGQQLTLRLPKHQVEVFKKS